MPIRSVLRSPLRSVLRPTIGEGVGVSGSLSALKGAVLRGESANVAIVGDSTADATTEWVYGFAAYVASLNSALTVTYRTYNDAGTSWNAPTTIQTGSGAETIAFWNASIASTKPTYLLGAKRAASIDGMPATIALGIINHGLNLVGYSFDYTRRAHLMMPSTRSRSVTTTPWRLSSPPGWRCRRYIRTALF